MVKTREVHDIHSESHIDIEVWVEKICGKVGLTSAKVPVLKKACEMAFHAEQELKRARKPQIFRASAFLTGLEMAEILADLGLDDESLIAAVLYRFIREGHLQLTEVEEQFGPVVASLIGSVLQMALISGMRNDSNQEVFGNRSNDQADKIRQMLVSIIDDVRVALIKLAERTCAIRNVKSASTEKRAQVAREIVDVYAPLAHRLGIGHLKWELEDLAFRYLDPVEYKRIASLLVEKRRDRQTYIQNAMLTLRDELARLGIQGDVSGRAKHIFSIWKKMQRKGVSFSKIYDIQAVRVLVPTVADCYTLLGVVHSKWRNIADEFDDYIAAPKENGYRSLHTAVIGPQHRPLEIQIRTYEMHEEAEFGICAHWQYKGADTAVSAKSYESKIAWLRQVLEWHDEIGSEHIKEIFRHDGSSDRIYVFTPEGHVVDLPLNSTPLDFAYHIHTEIGHRCRGCKINGRIAPLNTRLKTADQVEVLTAKVEAPSRDWLSKAGGFLYTSRARAKVQQWFRKQDFEKNTQAGKAMLEKKFRQLGISGIDLDPISEKFNKKGSAGLYAAIGSGEVGIEQVVQLVSRQYYKLAQDPIYQRRKIKAPRYGYSQFYIYGVGNLATRIARCCNPVPGEDICGYITSGRGVTIHREDCGGLLRLKTKEPERIIKAHWGGEPADVLTVPICLHAYDRSGLLSDIASTIDRMGLSISAIHSGDKKNGRVEVQLSIEVGDIKTLLAVLAKLRQIPNVVDVIRVSS